MKITICGSSAFRNEKVDIKEKLEKLGHVVLIHPHYIEAVKDGRMDIIERVKRGEHAQVKKEYNYIKWYHNAITNSDAILVINLEKNGRENYIGGNTLIEIGFAHVNDKKIFLYNPLPEDSPYLDEIKAMYNCIIYQDLNKIE